MSHLPAPLTPSPTTSSETGIDLELLAQEVIAMVAPIILSAAGVSPHLAPNPMDFGALLLDAGLTMKGRTSIDDEGLRTALAKARAAAAAGLGMHAASALITVALRARELGDAKTIAMAWSQALELMKQAA